MSDDFHPLIRCDNHRTQLQSATYATSLQMDRYGRRVVVA